MELGFVTALLSVKLPVDIFEQANAKIGRVRDIVATEADTQF